MEKIILKKSFVSKLILNQIAIANYQDIKDVCATRKKVSTRISFSKESINFGRTKVAVIKMGRKNMSLQLALNPDDYLDSKVKIKDCRNTKQGQTFGLAITIKGSKSLKYALELLNDALEKAGATAICSAEYINYFDLLYPRSIETLIAEGLIKKYIKTDKGIIEEPTTDLCIVSFNAKLMYEAYDSATDLYIISNYANWDPKKAIKMHKNADNTFEAKASYPKDTKLEFKICKSANWSDVEKGIWKEEIINHNYVLVDKDIEVEDLIYNFRKD